MTRARASILCLLLASVAAVASPQLARAQSQQSVPTTWSFHLGEATADLEDFVYGWNASFWAKSVPIIPYFPAFAAAIRRERQTGFLPPQLGTSTKKGFFAEIPFFWAISDSQDA